MAVETASPETRLGSGISNVEPVFDHRATTPARPAELQPSPAPSPSYASDDEARAFLQDRLAYLGKIYALIGLSFYLAGNLADAASRGFFIRRLDDPTTWVVPAVSLLFLAQWALCRGRKKTLSTLRAIDAAATVSASLLHAFMLFSAIPGELPGLSYARALLLMTFGLLIRAILIPSSPRRTLTLGMVAAGGTVAISQAWYGILPTPGLSPGMHAVWTALWCLGSVVIATLASHVIFGLRRQVREAWQFGQYTLLEKIGEGGMGAVYRASHAMLRRPTAVKLLRANNAGPDGLERFEREVQITSRLTHPNTVAIFDYGRTADGVFYYAMEYLDGLNLDELVRIDGPQAAGRIVRILRQVAASLTEAHGIGLIHRDIKPANVILMAERGGSPDIAKVVDFGLVKELDTTTETTRDWDIAGTPHYLAPEMIASPERVSSATDLYSLGCLGYYLVTGHTVFDGRTLAEVCLHHLHSQPLSPAARTRRRVPESLSRILMACLEKSPERRPASAQAFIELLDACVDIEEWTNETAREWWKSYDPAVLARIRRESRANQAAESIARSSSITRTVRAHTRGVWSNQSASGVNALPTPIAQ